MTTSDPTMTARALADRLDNWADMGDYGRGPSDTDPRREASGLLRRMATENEALRRELGASNRELSDLTEQLLTERCRRKRGKELAQVAAARGLKAKAAARQSELLAALNEGCSMTEAARRIGIHPSSAYRLKDRDFGREATLAKLDAQEKEDRQDG